VEEKHNYDVVLELSVLFERWLAQMLVRKVVPSDSSTMVDQKADPDNFVIDSRFSSAISFMFPSVSSSSNTNNLLVIADWFG
jgi:hypothetical protein